LRLGTHTDHSDHSADLLLETFSDGWWYTAGLPDYRRVIVCMTDSDQARRLGLRHADGYMQGLRETMHIQAVSGGVILEGPTLWAANTRWVEHQLDLPMMCVGDAGCCFDPVCGQGIVKAFRSCIFAAYAVADFLRHGDKGGLIRCNSMLDREITNYRATLRDFYLLEVRWPMRPFWSRRLAEFLLRPQPTHRRDQT
jgi:flavin-dependent dehydrogenase